MLLVYSMSGREFLDAHCQRVSTEKWDKIITDLYSSKGSSYEACKNKDEKDGLAHLNKGNEKQEIRNKRGSH